MSGQRFQVAISCLLVLGLTVTGCKQKSAGNSKTASGQHEFLGSCTQAGGSSAGMGGAWDICNEIYGDPGHRKSNKLLCEKSIEVMEDMIDQAGESGWSDRKCKAAGAFLVCEKPDETVIRYHYALSIGKMQAQSCPSGWRDVTRAKGGTPAKEGDSQASDTGECMAFEGEKFRTFVEEIGDLFFVRTFASSDYKKVCRQGCGKGWEPVRSKSALDFLADSPVDWKLKSSGDKTVKATNVGPVWIGEDRHYDPLLKTEGSPADQDKAAVVCTRDKP